MAVITLQNLDVNKSDEFNQEVSFFQDLTENEVNSTHGGAFWLAVVGAAWLGYSIAKEIKSKV